MRTAGTQNCWRFGWKRCAGEEGQVKDSSREVEISVPAALVLPAALTSAPPAHGCFPLPISTDGLRGVSHCRKKHKTTEYLIVLPPPHISQTLTFSKYSDLQVDLPHLPPLWTAGRQNKPNREEPWNTYIFINYSAYEHAENMQRRLQHLTISQWKLRLYPPLSCFLSRVSQLFERKKRTDFSCFASFCIFSFQCGGSPRGGNDTVPASLCCGRAEMEELWEISVKKGVEMETVK